RRRHTRSKRDWSSDVCSSDLTLALTERIMSAGHGGQILLSQSTYDLTRDLLPEKAQLIDMGEHRLKNIHRPEHLYQLNLPELPRSEERRVGKECRSRSMRES